MVALAARRAACGLEGSELQRALVDLEHQHLRSNDARVRVLAITYKSSETSDFVRLTSQCFQK